ncbi:MAG: preprotein translocase subunit SecG [Gammaproteobacteria bacterium]|nr:preprotein translocase subunit SecG [Gammaproteobacteria bacterium]
MLFSILVAVMVVLGIILVVLILLQQGKGADAGAAFGSGASGTVFGSRGSGSFMGKLTGALMGLFMILAVAMAWLGQHGEVSQVSSIMAGGNAPPAATASATQSTGGLQTQSGAPAGKTVQTPAASTDAARTGRQAAPPPATGSGA